MSANAPTRELSRRLAALSPDKLALLQRLARPAPGRGSEEIPVQARDGRRDFPLSSAQSRMWFNHQLSPGLPLYNESFGLKIKGELKIDLLARSIDYVVARHEIFTTTFHAKDGGLFQRLAGCSPPHLEVQDLSDLDRASGEAAYEKSAQRILRQPFELDRGPLFRAGLWTMEKDVHRLIFAMHHIIFDGWSGAIFLREVLSVYNSLSEGYEPDLKPPGLQYVDVAVWEETHFHEAAAAIDLQLDYWKNQLAGAPVPPQLPVDHHVPESLAAVAGREIFVCPRETTRELAQLAKESRATLFMALLAIFKLLLARYTGQEDVLVGLPTMNRNHGALGGIIGVFINTLILRTDLSGDVTFRELLARVSTTTIEAQAHQELPFERLVSALGRTGDAGRSLVTVMFDLQKKTETLVECPGLTIQSMAVGTGLTKFDLVLQMEHSDHELTGILDYAADKFAAETVRQLASDFVKLMQSAVAQPDVPTYRLAAAGDVDLMQSRVSGWDTFSETRKAPMLEVRAQALRQPGAVALAAGDSKLSYGELQRQANQLASFLRGRNIGKGQRVALFLPAGPEMVVAQLAVMMSGAAFVPIDVSTPPARVAFLIQDSEAALVLSNADAPNILPGPVAKIDLDQDCEAIANAPCLTEAAPVGEADPAYLLYTSGSTGQPKGVVISHGALANLCDWHRRAFGVTTADRATQIASTGFDASIWEVWPYLAAGASVHFPPRVLVGDSSGLRDWLVRSRITISFVPTPIAEEMIALPWPSKIDLRVLLTGGDRLRQSPARVLPFALVNNYGPTENAVVATSGPVVSKGNDPPSIGLPIDNVWVQIVDRRLQAVPRGARGELIVGGRSLASGYWNQPSLTAERFVTLADGSRVYRTGDVCRMRRNGEIEFLGRIDSQVKVRGCRIELSEIENALMAHGSIRDAVARVRESDNGSKRIVAYIVPEDDSISAESVRHFLANWLPAYMIPSSFVAIEAVPRTTNGKIDDERLREIDAQPISATVYRVPTTNTEREIESLWRNLLGLGAISVNDDFFQLGGDSLMATRFAVTIREKFAVDLPLAQMLKAPTIAAVAAWIDDAERAGPELPAGVIQLKEGRKSLAPLFLAPPASGSPSCYLVFAGAIQIDRPVYAFEAPGFTSGSAIACFKTQARKYVELLRAVQPRGPYYLAGWSLGGTVAFEMARQLREANFEVAYLGLLDAAVPENGRFPGGLTMIQAMRRVLSYSAGEGFPLNYRSLWLFGRAIGIAAPESFSDLRRRGWRGGARFLGTMVAQSWRSLLVLMANLRALKRYQPSSFDGEVTLFQTAPDANARDLEINLRENVGRWARSVSVHDAPGSHLTLFLNPRHAASFALSVGETIDSSTMTQRL